MTSTYAPHPAVGGAPVFVEDEGLRLPDAWSPPARPPLPLVASGVPIIGAVVLWLVTSSPLALVLAALGPLIAVASVVDARRAAGRDRRRAARDADDARARAAADIDRRHADERARRIARHPDTAGFLRRDGEIWRHVPERAGRLVVGVGDAASDIRVTGGRGDPRSEQLRADAARLRDAPIPIELGGGVAIVGPAVLAHAVHRALVLQLCLAVPPGEIRIVGSSDAAWVDLLPHRHASRGRSVAVTASAAVEADAVIAVVAPGAPLPVGCRAILTVDSVRSAMLDHDGVHRQVAVEAVGEAQATSIARDLAARAAHTLGLVAARDEPVHLADLVAAAPARRRGTLPAAIGADGAGVALIDLVVDGPHAVVAGVTGSGKSELLITWIVALASTHSTDDVAFLLADFKGGTAFDALRGLPHVTGVITDLDGSGARRAIESLRAEVRWREGQLASCGARDILDERVRLPRLVVVVDEFAALLGDHPELHAVFTDVAARGRALGIHLVLGTQRVSGVMRDSLLANCPLRLSLRVTDPADSRAVLGVDDAASLPGGADARGTALIRRAADTAPRRTRVALTSESDIARVAAATTGAPPRRPWLPDLPARLPLADVPRPTDGECVLVLGLADEPEQQRQRAVGLGAHDRGLLVVGGSGSGKSTALDVLAAQAEVVVRVPGDGEGAWDAVARLAAEPPPRGTLVVVDDLDTLASRVSNDHAPVLLERLERIVRSAGETGIILAASTQRLTGPAARIGELLRRRLVLGLASRADHIAAGGDSATYAADAPPGRGRLDRLAIQVAIAPAPPPPVAATPAAWIPSATLTGLVTRRRAPLHDMFARWSRRSIRCMSLEQYAADPAATADGPVVVVGDPDEWQREWRLLAAVRADHDLVIDTSCAAEYRVLSASRELPPYTRPGMSRAWLHRAGGDAERIVLVDEHVRSERREDDS